LFGQVMPLAQEGITKAYCIEVHTDVRTYFLCAGDKDEMDRWLVALKKVPYMMIVATARCLSVNNTRHTHAHTHTTHTTHDTHNRRRLWTMWGRKSIRPLSAWVRRI
jgi:hypothetical protein